MKYPLSIIMYIYQIGAPMLGDILNVLTFLKTTAPNSEDYALKNFKLALHVNENRQHAR